MSRYLEDDLAELDGARAGALWPWTLFAGALFAGLVFFFVYTPR